MLRPDEVHIVGGGVVFGKSSPLAALEAADGEVESRRAELSLVVAIRRKILKDSVRPVAKDLRHRPVDKGVSSPASFVDRTTTIADAGDGQAVVNVPKPFLVGGKPR